MARTTQDRQEPGGQRRKDGNALWVGAEKLLGKLHHYFKAARLLQGSRATDDRNDCQHHGYRRLTRGQTEDKDHEHQTDAGNKTKSDTTISSA